jgi:hypothetical protein
VYKKHTHTYLYLNATSHHQTVNKQVILSTLVHRAKAVCDTDSLPQELKFFQETFRNGYSERQILCALNPPMTTPPPSENHTSVVFLAFVITFNRTSRVLSKHNIKTLT